MTGSERFLRKLGCGFTFLDGGTGTILQSMGLAPGERSEDWCLTHPDRITELHLAYLNAGSDVVNTNTFGANVLKMDEAHLEKVLTAAVACAREAVRRSGKEAFVALDIGPTGKLLKPYGTMDFEEAVEVFAKTVRIGARLDVDLVTIETMTDLAETKAAVLAVKENSRLPFLVTNVYDATGRTMTGSTPEALTAMLEGLGACAVGVNCSLGPDQMKNLIPRFAACASVPVVIKPNAGLPDTIDGKTVYNITPEAFAAEMRVAAEHGAVVLGGCCGTTPDYIRALTAAVADLTPAKPRPQPYGVVASARRVAQIGHAPIIVGERINPTGKPKLKAAIREGDLDYIVDLALDQADQGAQVLDVNVGLPGTDEKRLLSDAVDAICPLCELPLQLDSADPQALERAMRRYPGKPMVNSVNAKRESLDTVLPLVKKYGGLVVGLTLDEDGIPETAQGRVQLAKRIYEAAAGYGISPRDVIIDPLTLTVSTDPGNADVTLEAVRRIKTELGGTCILGVSNISFGLPARPVLGAVFLTMALCAGLDAAIINPGSPEMLRAMTAYRALTGRDPGFRAYTALMADASPEKTVEKTEKTPADKLFDAVLNGDENAAARQAQVCLEAAEPTAVINDTLIPALNEVGARFESGRIFLPGLLLSAKAASAAFDAARARMQALGGEREPRGTVVIATVKGDIHDIGKNIVKAVMENFGFEIVDLGRDVPAETVLRAVRDTGARLCGLSALMTTTVPAMEETARLIKREAPECAVMVGGAVLTEDIAKSIGADYYAADAMAAVRIGEQIYPE